MGSGRQDGRGRQRAGGRGPGQRGPEGIGSILDRWVAQSRGARKDLAKLEGAWQDVVGGEVGALTRVTGLRSGVLTVEVASAPLLNELATYYRHEILESLRERPEFPGLRGLCFRAGAFREGAFREGGRGAGPS